jgi:hypothetical protein
MRISLALLLTVVLVGAVGCNRGTPGGAGATTPATSGDAATPEPTVARKPIFGEADDTFRLTMPLRAVTVKQGEETTFEIGINRGRNFGEDVAITLDDLPAGVALVTENAAIQQGDAEAELVLEASDDAALGEFTVKVTGHPAQNGVDASNELKLTVAQR